jgi:hypothetical protein
VCSRCLASSITTACSTFRTPLDIHSPFYEIYIRSHRMHEISIGSRDRRFLFLGVYAGIEALSDARTP